MLRALKDSVEVGVLVSGRRLGEGVLGDEALGLGVEPLDVGLELGRLHTPLAAAADLHRAQVAAAHECIGLRARDVQDLRDIGELQEPGPGPGAGGSRHKSNCATDGAQLRTVACVGLWTKVGMKRGDRPCAAES